jgi:subtilisin family serine protease
VLTPKITLFKPKRDEKEKMSKKTAALLTGFVIFMLIATLSLPVLTQPKAYADTPTASNANPNDSFTPTPWKPAWADQDNNGIADSLDEEIAERTANGTAQDYINVTVMLKSAPTTQDAADFISSDGYLTTPPWTEATYGFGGTIPYDDIANFTQKCSSVLLIEKEAVGKATVAYAAQQVGARPYVWSTLGLQGDPNASTAIVDTGIDGSHVDFQPGYGDLDFSKKIVGWKDELRSTPSPIDDNGHGSHVAGIAAGDGFFSVDALGYATATWGTSLSGSSNEYTWTTMMVNNTGTITLSVKWRSTGTIRLSSLSLYMSGKGLYSSYSSSQVASQGTSSSNTWYSLSFSVTSTPSGGYDMYNPRLNVAGGTGSLYVVVNMSWPYVPPADGFAAWTGIAPQSKLVGVKVLGNTGTGTEGDFISGVNWIIANRMNYHITVASMSLSFDSENLQVDEAVASLVNSGVSVVVAAGNDGPGGNSVSSPASVDEVISVAAMNQFDDITSYSSQGGTSRYTSETMKPDITAPGGSHYAVPLFSADSNYDDMRGGFSDVQANDSAPMQGTSMATPVIAGCAQVVIQAMGGYAEWNWTRSQALLPKMILLMTATETYPNLRELGTFSTSPTLDRGGKDSHEGYGRVNLDAAVDAVLKSYAVGSVVTDSLGTPPTLDDVSVLGERLAWARNVQLVSGGRYNFSLSVPAGADYDLYLYNSNGTDYGEPAIVAKSTNANTGGTEQFWVTAPYSGTYYLVVKRATETTGSGDFTLSSSAQYYITVDSEHGGPTTSQWVEQGSDFTASVTSPTEVAAGDHQRVCTGYSVDDGVSQPGTSYTFTNVQAPHTIVFNWVQQFYLTVNSAYGAPGGGGWYDSGATANAFLSSDVAPGAAGVQYAFAGWSGDASGTHLVSNNIVMDNAKTATANWATQYYLTLASDYGTVGFEGWYDSGTSAYAVVDQSTVAGTAGTQHVFAGWGGDASGNASTSNAIVMNAPKTAIAHWKTQHYLDASANFGSVSPSSGWYDEGSTVAIEAAAPSADPGEQYVWNGWTGTGSGNYTGADNQASVVMNEAVAEAASWVLQYYLNVTSPYGLITPESGWFDAGTPISASVSSPVAESVLTQHVCIGWKGTGSVPASGTASSVLFMLDEPSSIAWNWEIQYTPTFLLAVVVLAVLAGSAVYVLLRRRRKRKQV